MLGTFERAVVSKDMRDVQFKRNPWPMFIRFDRPAVLMDLRDVQPRRKAQPMLVTLVREVVSMDMRDMQPERNSSPIVVLPWLFVRVTFPEGQPLTVLMSWRTLFAVTGATIHIRKNKKTRPFGDSA